jgi:hypothetical protein
MKMHSTRQTVDQAVEKENPQAIEALPGEYELLL